VPGPVTLRSVVEKIAQRTEQIVDALGSLSTDALLGPSSLPDWSRLTIACHLRYGASALLDLTRAAVSAEPAAYYPLGRASQRPGTLVPTPGEQPHAVVEALGELSGNLDQLWRSFSTMSWDLQVLEPPDNPDLGAMPLSGLPFLRLTEVEVHGSDLELGLDEWSRLFVETGLPMRLSRLGVRRTNHRAFDGTLEGSWLLIADDGPTYKITVNGNTVESQRADASEESTAVIEASSRDLLALLLGRPFRKAPRISGDVEFGEAFSAAFPGP
jgi:maleylpyruvate isomerase